jgi:SAM-dependent methyltransferase
MSERPAHPGRRAPTVPRWHNEWLSVNLLARALGDLIPLLAGPAILDIGCGNKPYRGFFPREVDYVGVDVAPANRSADVVACTLCLPFAAESFDAALCTQVLEHVEAPAGLLREASRVLRPKGRLLVSAPMYWPHHGEPYDYFRFTRYGLERLLADAGFRVERVMQQGGAWRVVGQAFANAVQDAVQCRTFGLKAATFVVSNTMFDWLDRVSNHEHDACNFAALARKA